MPISSRFRLASHVPWLLLRRVSTLASLDRFPGLRNAALVTFDVFDTALLRAVSHPDDVFGLSAWRAIKRHGLPMHPESLVEQRREAHLAALRAQAALGRQEASIDYIYGCHPTRDDAIRRLLLAEELDTERDVTRADGRALRMYSHLKESGLRLAFLSDTPFSSAFVTELLARAGYPGPLEVYVSSEIGKSKASGAAFGNLAHSLGLAPGRIWHIGDNPRSDVIAARKSGIHALWYRPLLRRLHSPPLAAAADSDLARSVVTAATTVVTHDCAGRGSALRSVGAAVAGPLNLAFAQQLIGQVGATKAQKVFFLSRDAFVPKEFYDRLSKLLPAPPSAYLFVSRRSLVFPMIDKVGDAELDFLCSHERPLSLEEFFSRIGMDIGRFSAQVTELGLEPGRIMKGSADLAAIRSLFRTLAPSVLDQARSERALLLRYLTQEQFLQHEPVAVCDVGWNGTSQRSLARIRFDHGVRDGLSGYYVGTSNSITSLRAEEGTAQGWLLDEGKPRFGIDVLQYSWILLELLFSAPHGSTIGYEEVDGSIRPVLRDQAADGFVRASAEIQAAAVAFLDVFLSAFGGLPPPRVDERATVERLAGLFSRPRLNEAVAIGDVTTIEGLGDMRTAYAIAAPPHWRTILARPTSLLATYRQAFWRRGFTMRLLRNRHLMGMILMLRGET